MNTFTTNPMPPADRFRPGDVWRSPDGRLHTVTRLDSLRGPCVLLSPCGRGRSQVIYPGSVDGWQRQTWGGKR